LTLHPSGTAAVLEENYDFFFEQFHSVLDRSVMRKRQVKKKKKKKKKKQEKKLLYFRD